MAVIQMQFNCNRLRGKQRNAVPMQLAAELATVNFQKSKSS